MNIQNNQNNTQSFGAKLYLRSRNENFPFTKSIARNIEETFERTTQKVKGELTAVYDKTICGDDHYRFHYRNGEHRDLFSLSVTPEFSNRSVFSQKLNDILNLFTKREEKINEITQLKTKLEEDTIKSLKEITPSRDHFIDDIF